MRKEKQIEEMASDIEQSGMLDSRFAQILPKLRGKNERRRVMIIEIAHIRTADNTDFVDQLRKAIVKMQNECGLNIEVQYQTIQMQDGYRKYIVYSALVIGREIRTD